jgi:hypothetical protein
VLGKLARHVLTLTVMCPLEFSPPELFAYEYEARGVALSLKVLFQNAAATLKKVLDYKIS